MTYNFTAWALQVKNERQVFYAPPFAGPIIFATRAAARAWEPRSTVGVSTRAVKILVTVAVVSK